MNKPAPIAIQKVSLVKFFSDFFKSHVLLDLFHLHGDLQSRRFVNELQNVESQIGEPAFQSSHLSEVVQDCIELHQPHGTSVLF